MKLEKSVTVKSIQGIYDELVKEFEKDDELVIDLSDVERVDLSFVQLLISAGRKAREQKKVIRVKGVSTDLKNLIKLSGIKV